MPQFELAAPDLVMVLLYVVFIVGLGFYFAKRTETTDDYFLAGRSLTWWLIGFSLFASNVSSSTLVGLSSAAFSSGISVYNYEWMAALVVGHLAAVFFFGLALSGSIIVQTHALSPEELQMATAGTPVIHFLYLAPLLLVISLVALVVVSLATEKPDEEVVRALTWSPAILAEETPALARLAWYKNYRYQSAAMLVLIAIFVITWW